MLREIKHICGHIETYQIPRGQFARSKRFHEKRLCRDCWIKQEDEKKKTAAEENARSGLPSLKGPLGLISGAEVIRHDFFDFVRENAIELKEKGAEFQIAVDLLRSKQDCRWWHAHKRERFVHLFDLAMDHAAHKIRLKALEPEIHAKLQSLRLVPLSGSTKQIKWAEDIRRSILLDLIGVEYCLQEALNDRHDWAEFLQQLCKNLEPVPHQLDKMSRELALMDSSAHWIEVRNYSVEELAKWMHRPETLVRILHMIQGRFFFILNL